MIAKDKDKSFLAREGDVQIRMLTFRSDAYK